MNSMLLLTEEISNYITSLNKEECKVIAEVSVDYFQNVFPKFSYVSEKLDPNFFNYSKIQLTKFVLEYSKLIESATNHQDLALSFKLYLDKTVELTIEALIAQGFIPLEQRSELTLFYNKEINKIYGSTIDDICKQYFEEVI